LLENQSERKKKKKKKKQKKKEGEKKINKNVNPDKLENQGKLKRHNEPLQTQKKEEV
jgi:hypothetical protein